MAHQRTTEQLDDKLTEEGFVAYPSMPNKYWNADGRIIWTDGDFYQSNKGSDWERYNEDRWDIVREYSN